LSSPSIRYFVILAGRGKIMKPIAFFALSLIAIFIVSLQLPLLSQDAACPTLVDDALTAVGNTCTGLGRNQVCYGNNRVTALTWEQATLGGFELPGDTANLADIASLVTAPLNVTDSIWGVALLRLQADLPDTLPGQNVTFVVFGETNLRSETIPDADTIDRVTYVARTNGGVNLRSGPGTSYAIVGSSAAGETLTIIGRNEAEDWLRVETDNQEESWVFADLVTLEGNVKALAIIEHGQGVIDYTAPMQAFRLTTGIGQPACVEAPRDGILVQAPKQTRVNFLINGIEVQLGSTAFLSAETETSLTISTFEGDVTVTSGNTSQTIEPGFTLTVIAGQPPQEPQPYEFQNVQAAPVQLLPEQISIPQSASSPSSEATSQVGSEENPESTETPRPPTGGGGGATITVSGNGWIDSGVFVQAGQTFTISATGSVNGWNLCSSECEDLGLDNCGFVCANTVNGPAGGVGTIAEIAPGAVSLFPLPNANFWALAGRIGTGEPFLVGEGGTFTANADGTLQFAINDAPPAHPQDLNQGEFLVMITVE
jgi:hypothetical protein